LPTTAAAAPLPLHDALPIFRAGLDVLHRPPQPLGDYERDQLLRGDLQLPAETTAHVRGDHPDAVLRRAGGHRQQDPQDVRYLRGDRKSTRLNSSHVKISYAV